MSMKRRGGWVEVLRALVRFSRTLGQGSGNSRVRRWELMRRAQRRS